MSFDIINPNDIKMDALLVVSMGSYWVLKELAKARNDANKTCAFNNNSICMAYLA